jgi:hypothetical protein
MLLFIIIIYFYCNRKSIKKDGESQILTYFISENNIIISDNRRYIAFGKVYHVVICSMYQVIDRNNPEKLYAYLYGVV